MLTRSTVVAALAGVFVALLIVSSFLALDRTTLHWYAAEPAGLTATEAEAYALSHLRHGTNGPPSWLKDGWQPDCEARDHSRDGWLIRCVLVNTGEGKRLGLLLTYLVADDGAVVAFP